MKVIYSKEPKNWQDLEIKVASILAECGMAAQRNKEITTVRGKVTVDVLAIDPHSSPELIYLCECKHWSAAIPRSVVHSFRTVVQDFGAHLGILISRQGFQSGALDAAELANIKLLTWVEFQKLFINRWKEYRYNTLRPLFEDVFEYYDYFSAPIGNAISGNQERLAEWSALLKMYEAVADANPWNRTYSQSPWPPALPVTIEQHNEFGDVHTVTFEDYSSFYAHIEALGIEALVSFQKFVEKYRTGDVGK